MMKAPETFGFLAFSFVGMVENVTYNRDQRAPFDGLFRAGMPGRLVATSAFQSTQLNRFALACTAALLLLFL
jgi:hypothetical protein